MKGKEELIKNKANNKILMLSSFFSLIFHNIATSFFCMLVICLLLFNVWFSSPGCGNQSTEPLLYAFACVLLLKD